MICSGNDFKHICGLQLQTSTIYTKVEIQTDERWKSNQGLRPAFVRRQFLILIYFEAAQQQPFD